MPEWAARYFIKITDVRAERLQEIISEDGGYKKEGMPPLGIIPVNSAMLMTGTDNLDDLAVVLSIAQFGEYWDSINKDYPWESNPWVFRYQFEVIA